MNDQQETQNEAQLSEREMMIAKKAAELAVQQLSDEFYKSIGKNVVQRWLIWIGLLAAGFAGGKGWLATLFGKG